MPPLAEKCIASWRKFLPDYEIKRWDETNFDVNIIPYTREAYVAKKYAFVSDYARFWILYKYGGLYFDTDVEIIRPLDDIIARGPFMGFETDPMPNSRNHSSPADSDEGAARQGAVAPGLGLGVNPSLGLMKKLLDCYDRRHFTNEVNMRNQITIVAITTQLLMKEGLRSIEGIQYVGGVYIYPSEYFCPISVFTGRLHITLRTRTIHHYAGTWVNARFSLKDKLKRMLPEWIVLLVMKMKSKNK